MAEKSTKVKKSTSKKKSTKAKKKPTNSKKKSTGSKKKSTGSKKKPTSAKKKTGVKKKTSGKKKASTKQQTLQAAATPEQLSDIPQTTLISDTESTPQSPIKSAKKSVKKSTKKSAKKTSKKKQTDTEITEPVIKEVISIGADLDEEKVGEDGEEILVRKWWLEEPFRSLLDPDLIKTVDFSKFDLSSLIQEFTERMVAEELIDFRISGLAIYSSAQLYHTKITGVIKQEEDIQKAVMRERIRRQIPKAIAQPLREARKIATSEELFGAMRRAIIETMQKREKLRINRERKMAKKETQVKKKGKGRLPAEILKHITGNSETIEDRLKYRHRQMVEIIRMENPPDRTVSMDYFKDMIYHNPDYKIITKKVKYIQSFEEMLFLASLNKVVLHQEETESPLYIKLIDQTSVEF